MQLRFHEIISSRNLSLYILRFYKIQIHEMRFNHSIQHFENLEKNSTDYIFIMYMVIHNFIFFYFDSCQI